MQRIVPFGREYRVSDEFTLDETSSVTLWLVREDRTTTPGTATAEVQLRSQDGQRWTTVHVLDDDQPSITLHGAEETLTYRVVVKADSLVAVDATDDDAQSSTQRGNTNPAQPDRNAATPVVIYAVSGTDSGATGLSTNSPAFGSIFGPAPAFDITVAIIPDGDLTVLISGVNGEDYDGGSVVIWSECDPESPYVLPIASENISGAIITVFDEDTAVVLGPTFFVALVKSGQDIPDFDLGATTGRFELDQNDIPARFSAWPFATADQYVQLYAVDDNDPEVVIPVYEDGNPVRAHLTNPVFAIDAPGIYEWRRSCDVVAGVYVNTGWATP